MHLMILYSSWIMFAKLICPAIPASKTSFLNLTFSPPTSKVYSSDIAYLSIPNITVPP